MNQALLDFCSENKISPDDPELTSKLIEEIKKLSEGKKNDGKSF